MLTRSCLDNRLSAGSRVFRLRTYCWLFPRLISTKPVRPFSLVIISNITTTDHKRSMVYLTTDISKSQTHQLNIIGTVHDG
ncbi:hypothetical protein E4T47_05884 [Aureobasidium subglaciale]|nr:hypothetical protein E4T43_05555 [Aureobasidium subglaciale]KAI5270775.1 hypothetical protein E4T47_05884 [Aureobasidium subglaciale]